MSSSGEPSLVLTLHLMHPWASSTAALPGAGPRVDTQVPLLGSNHSFLPFLENGFLPALSTSSLFPKAQPHLTHGSLLFGFTQSRVTAVIAGSVV